MGKNPDYRIPEKYYLAGGHVHAIE